MLKFALCDATNCAAFFRRPEFVEVDQTNVVRLLEKRQTQCNRENGEIFDGRNFDFVTPPERTKRSRHLDSAEIYRIYAV